MKKIIVLVIALIAAHGTLKAQQTLTAKEMVGLTPIVCSEIEIPTDAQKSLSMKLYQMVTQNGMGSTSGRFALVPNVVILDKQVTATVPAKYIIEMEVSMYVVDVIEQTILDEKSFVVKGVDQNANKAIIQAINTIAPRSPQNRQFIDGCRTKIIDYYSTRVPTLVKKANMLADQERYDEALATLVDIPENVDQYDLVADRMVVIYKKRIDQDAKYLINEAKGAMAIKKYDDALKILVQVNPGSSHAKSAETMMNSIKNSIEMAEREAAEKEIRRYEEDKAERSKQQDNAVEIRKLEIQAQKDASTYRTKAIESFAQSASKWFFGKFKR